MAAVSECVGEGCTYPGCSGRSADQVNAYARSQGSFARVQQAWLAARQEAEGVAVQPNREARRRAARAARRNR